MAGKCLALLIGNSVFEENSGFRPLRCSAADVEALNKLLSDESHGPFEVTPLVNATQRQIQMAISRILTSTASTDDLVLIYYSGHGSPDGDGTLHLAASDSLKSDLPVTAVSLEFIVRRMRSSKSERIVLILDCCYSGSVERMFTKGEVSDQVRTGLPKELSGSGMYVLTASTDVQLAEEKEQDQNSLLTKHIISGIADGHADLDDDGVVTMHELLLHVQRSVKHEGEQEPLGFALRIGGGELAIARTGKPAQRAKAMQVEEAIWNARKQYYVPMPTAQRVWSMITEQALRDGGETAKKRLNRLHSLLDDPDAFVRELHELASTAERAKEETISGQSKESPSVGSAKLPLISPPLVLKPEQAPFFSRNLSKMLFAIAVAGVVLMVLLFVSEQARRTKEKYDEQQTQLHRAQPKAASPIEPIKQPPFSNQQAPLKAPSDAVSAGQSKTSTPQEMEQTNLATAAKTSAAPTKPKYSLSRSRVIEIARNLQHAGAPFVWGGKNPNGFDSSGFITYVLRAAGMSINPSACNSACLNKKFPHITRPQEGDVVFYGENIIAFVLDSNTWLGVDGDTENGNGIHTISASENSSYVNAFLEIPYTAP
ncbi:caspase, EACC1-associated type [Tunturiibacter lichenicola]|uniref:caspase, EACC1-associated type n=1 Tax=Tunturiibacter lichenicola TaxID=2051959 RepID=UPI003D9B38E3